MECFCVTNNIRVYLKRTSSQYNIASVSSGYFLTAWQRASINIATSKYLTSCSPSAHIVVLQPRSRQPRQQVTFHEEYSHVFRLITHAWWWKDKDLKKNTSKTTSNGLVYRTREQKHQRENIEEKSRNEGKIPRVERWLRGPPGNPSFPQSFVVDLPARPLRVKRPRVSPSNQGECDSRTPETRFIFSFSVALK